MIYKVGAKVKFKVGTGYKCGVIIGRNCIGRPDFPYHVKSDDNNDYWISEDAIVSEESNLKYKVGDRVKFKNEIGYEIVEYRNGTITRLSKWTEDPQPYSIEYSTNGIKYCKWVSNDDILGYAEEHIDYTAFYAGRRPGKSVEPKWDSLPDDGVLYSKKDVEFLEKMYSRILNAGAYLPKIKKVIFNDPATIVFWEDGTKTVVKAQTSVCGQIFADNQPLIDLTKTDLFDPEKGLAMAIAKKALGNQGNYYEEFKTWLPKEEKNDKKNRR